MNEPVPSTGEAARYETVFGEVSEIGEAARRVAARSVNAAMAATYWLIGRHMAEFEQEGRTRAEYCEQTVERLAADLPARHGRGHSVRNVWQMRAFYLAWPILQTASAESLLNTIRSRFPLPWSAYVRLLSVRNERARAFYGTGALRGGWTVRQLDRDFLNPERDELYDLAADPGEAANLIRQPRAGRVLARLHARLVARMRAVGDRLAPN